MASDRTVAQDLAVAIVGGLVIAVLYLFLLGGLWASWAAGIAFGLTTVAAIRMFDELGHVATTIAAAAAGFLSGFAWWAIAETTIAWWVAPCIGAGLGFIEVGAAEWRDWKLEREAVPYAPPIKSQDGAV